MLHDWTQRVFGTNNTEPEPAALLEHLQRRGFEVSGKFRGDDQGWFSAEIAYASAAEPLKIERYLASEEGIRAELNTWAAWLERLEQEQHPNAVQLMQHMISTQQLFTLRQPLRLASLVPSNEVCRSVCQFLAQTTEGVYQADGQGIFAADGTVLVDWDD